MAVFRGGVTEIDIISNMESGLSISIPITEEIPVEGVKVT